MIHQALKFSMIGRPGPLPDSPDWNYQDTMEIESAEAGNPAGV
jgi:hypothetical protein